MMKTKGLKRIFLLLLLLGIMYNFLTSINHWSLNLNQNKSTKTKNYDRNSTSKVLGTHVPMPLHLRGKQLPFHQIFEPRDVGFPPDMSKKRYRNSTSKVLGTHVPMPLHLRGKKLPFHQIFEPRDVGFPPNMPKKRSSNVTKTIILWTSWNSILKTINYYFLQPGTFSKHNCPNPNCIATFNRKKLMKADAVLFHLIDIKITDLPAVRNQQQVWILYNMEPPWQVKKQSKYRFQDLNHLFNWTMGYKNNSDVVVKYGFTMPSRKDHNQSLPESFIKKSKNVVWFVSDCSTDSRREDYVKELQKYIDVDIYGKCGNSTCYPSQSHSCYASVLKHYKFYLSFENAICKDYATEKFFNVFNHDIVPVVFGGARYSWLAPKDSFIDVIQYPQPRLLAKTLIQIGSNETVYNEFLKRKISYEAFLDPWMCRLCDKLHSTVQSTVLDNVDKWFFQDDQCKMWDNRSETYVDTAI